MEGLGPFALALTLTGITTLFGVLIAVWLLLRRPAPDWNALRHAGALEALWVSTACLLASSAAVECAARLARRGLQARRAALACHVAGLGLGLGFLGAQGWLWLGLARAGLVPSSGGHAAVLYSLTGLHALHVLGGLGFLFALTLRLARARARLPGLRLGAVYWHYMGALWLVLFALLYFVR
jgi:cytochrome c oxidase subunit III